MRKTALLIIACCAACLGAQAQDSPQATIKAAEVVIKKYTPKYVEPITDELCDKFRKNPEVMVGIADAYLYKQNDTTMAYKYLRRALEVKSDHAPAYQLGGEIEESVRDTAKAVEWYERGIAAAPKDPSCYLAYAKLMSMKNPEAAQKRIEELLTHDPTFPVNIELAKMYERVADNIRGDEELQKQMYQKSIDQYALCDMNTIPKDKLVSYGIMLYSNSKDFDKAIEVARFGAEKFKPVNSEFNRLGVVASYGLQNWADAVEFGEATFKADSLIPRLDDFWNLARAYRNIKKFPEAISTANKLIANDTIPEEQKLDAYQLIAECHKETENWTDAIKEYENYIKKKEEYGELDAYDVFSIGDTYMKMAANQSGDDRIKNFKKADTVFINMAERFPDKISLALTKRYEIGTNLVKTADGEQDWDAGIVKPIAEQLISVIQANNETDNLAKARLKMCYNYLAFYYLNSKNKNIKTSKSYFQKILEIDPENANALKALQAFK